jgi:hypothetical protein
LLSAASADTEQSLDRGAVDPRFGVFFELPDGLGKSVQPEGLIGHF